MLFQFKSTYLLKILLAICATSLWIAENMKEFKKKLMML